jgi:hypothetical protein
LQTEHIVAVALNGFAACRYTTECDGFITGAAAEIDTDWEPEILVTVTPDLVKWAKHKTAAAVHYDGKRLVVLNRAQQELFVQPGTAKKNYQPIQSDQFFQKREQCGANPIRTAQIKRRYLSTCIRVAPKYRSQGIRS